MHLSQICHAGRCHCHYHRHLSSAHSSSSSGPRALMSCVHHCLSRRGKKAREDRRHIAPRGVPRGVRSNGMRSMLAINLCSRARRWCSPIFTIQAIKRAVLFRRRTLATLIPSRMAKWNKVATLKSSNTLEGKANSRWAPVVLVTNARRYC